MNVTEEGSIALSDVKYVPETLVDREARWVKSGDVLFNNTNSPELVGKTAYYGLPEPRAFSNHMTRVRCKADALDAEYCALVLHHKWRMGYFRSICNNHVSQASISRSALLDTAIPLPSLPIQRRIVDQAKSLLSRVRSSKGRLELVTGLMTRFRQAVLAAACSGRLTEEWRRGRSVRPDDELLRLLEGQGVRRSALAPTAEFELDVPEEWPVVSVDQIASLITSGSRGWTRYYHDDGPATFLMAQNVRPLRFDRQARTKLRLPANESERDRTRVRLGDVLVTIVGANTGDACRVPQELEEYYVCQSVALIRPVIPALSRFLELWLNSPAHGRMQYLAWIYGEGRPHLSFDHLRTTAVALPCLEEQQEICLRVERLLVAADAIAKAAAGAAMNLGTLPEAILAKAFRGDLLSQNTEPDTCEDRELEVSLRGLPRLAT